MKTKTIQTLLAMPVALLASISNASAVTVFTDRAAWTTALAGASTTTETFSPGNPLVVDTITTSTGITIQGFDPDGSSSSSNSGGIWEAHLRHPTFSGAGVGDTSFIWTFPTQITAFALDIRASGSAGDLLITGNFDGAGDASVGLFSQSIISGNNQLGFVGLIGEQPFDSITFSLQTSGFMLLTTEQADFNTVPEPSSVILGLAGTLALVGRRKRK